MKFKPDTAIPTLVGLGGFEKKDEKPETVVASETLSTATHVAPGESTEEASVEGPAEESAAEGPSPAAVAGNISNTIFILFGVLALVVVGVSLTMGRS